jgi:hypothetical protein
MENWKNSIAFGHNCFKALSSKIVLKYQSMVNFTDPTFHGPSDYQVTVHDFRVNLMMVNVVMHLKLN